MMEEFQDKGYWWLPSQPERKISGTLKYHPVLGITLELMGSFRAMSDPKRKETENIILGKTANNREITLYKCYASGFSLSMGVGVSTSSYTAIALFVGYHFQAAEDVAFSSFSIGYYYLEDWTGITGFALTHEKDGSGRFSKQVVTYSFPDKIVVDVGDLNISINHRLQSGGNNLAEVSMKQVTYLKVTSQKPVSFEEFNDRINFLLHNFLSFGLGRATRPLFITATNENSKEQFPDGTLHDCEIEIYYGVNELPDVPKKVHPADMLFLLSDIRDSLDLCLNSWFLKGEILRPVYELYFANLNSSSMYLTHEFLNLTQALESYHRRVAEGHYVDDQAFEDLYRSLLNSVPPSIPDNFKSALKQRFKYLNEFSLRKRLGELIIKCSPMFLEFIKDSDTFIETVVATRNYLTHFDKKPIANVLHGEALYWVTRKLRVLLEICLMLEIGLSVKLINQLVNRNRQMVFLGQK